jgi:hypothetical protein
MKRIVPLTAIVVGPRIVLGVSLGWLLVATALGAAGVVRARPPAAVPLVLLALTVLVLAAVWGLAEFRAWLAALDVRWLVALHLTRFVGAYFLYLYGQGQLPYAFAVPGGIGDIAVATLAAVLLVAGPPRDARRRLAYGAWNVPRPRGHPLRGDDGREARDDGSRVDGGADPLAAEPAADVPGAAHHRQPRAPRRAAGAPGHADAAVR